MMTATLPDIDIPCKTLKRGIDLPLGDEPLAEFCSDGETKTPSAPGSIMIRIDLSGSRSVHIIADQSDVEDTMSQRLEVAQPVLELLPRIFTVEQPSSIQ